MSGIVHLPPLRAPRRFYLGMFACCAAPIFWVGQLLLGYGVSATACYGSDHPTPIDWPGTLRGILATFDAVAILAAIAGGAVALWLLRNARAEVDAHGIGTEVQVESRVKFLAIWGLFSSLWFFAAIAFNTIASLGTPLCTP